MEINNSVVAGEVQNNISIVGGIVGHAIRIQGGDYGTLMLDSVQCWPKTVRNESGAMHVIIRGKTQMLQTIAGYSAMGLENVHCNTSINAYPGTVRVDAPGEPLWGGPEYEVQDRLKVTRTGASGASSTDPWLQVLTENEKQFRLGILDSNRDFVGYDIYRNSGTGALEFDGSHPAFTSYNFDGDVTVPGEVYGPGWNGSNEVPTKNDVYDKVETLGITVGRAVTGGGANRVIYEDASQNVAASSRLTYSGGNLSVAGGATTDYTEVQSLQTGGDGNARMALGVGGTATGDGYQDKGYVLAGSSLAGMLIQASGPIELSSPSVSSTGDITVPGEAYGVSWNGSNEVPTKNDVYDKIETIGGVTNSAGSNVITKSNGTNLVASQITDDGTTVKIGTSAADAGILGLPNNSLLKARNAANSGNIDMFKVNASDQLELAGGTFKVTDSGSAFYFESKTGADSEKAYLGKGHYAGAHLYSSDGFVTLGAQSGGIVVHSLYSGSDAVVRMRSGGASQPILRVHNDGAAQTADMQQWSDDTNATNIYSRINKAGYFMTRKTSAPADGDIATSELAIWFDNTSGAAKIKFKGKDSGGTVRTGEVALT
mgnify:CR=1 FL=1